MLVSLNGLNRSIRDQHDGLLGNVTNHVLYRANLVSAAGQVLNRFSGGNRSLG